MKRTRSDDFIEEAKIVPFCKRRKDEQEKNLIKRELEQYLNRIPDNVGIVQAPTSNSCGEFKWTECPECGHDDICDFFQEGDTVCRGCGYVFTVPIYRELVPLCWGSLNSDSSMDVLASSTRLLGTTYNPGFHLNEQLALLQMSGPSIPRYAMEIIQLYLQDAIKQQGRPPDKGMAQAVCRSIDADRLCGKLNLDESRIKDVNVPFAQKYSERWISIIFACTGERPAEFPIWIKSSVQTIFSRLMPAWNHAKHLLPGSKPGQERRQLPNYICMIYMIMLTEDPEYAENLEKYLPRLSVKKMQQIMDCFNCMSLYIGLNPITFPERVKVRMKHSKRRK